MQQPVAASNDLADVVGAPRGKAPTVTRRVVYPDFSSFLQPIRPCPPRDQRHGSARPNALARCCREPILDRRSRERFKPVPVGSAGEQANPVPRNRSHTDPGFPDSGKVGQLSTDPQQAKEQESYDEKRQIRKAKDWEAWHPTCQNKRANGAEQAHRISTQQPRNRKSK